MQNRDCAVILTCYNRPSLVVDAIRALLEQDCQRARTYILDDGCDDATREAIAEVLAPQTLPMTWDQEWECVIESDAWCWRLGPRRPMAERKAKISYSIGINYALNHLLRDEKYVCATCDDDYLYPEAVRVRAEFLDANPAAHVCYGRSRSVQYDANGFNSWSASKAPAAGRAYPRPSGRRELIHDGCAAKTYFENGETDPQTGLAYVEEAVWHPGPMRYGYPYKTDHSQVMHRRECLTTCRPWPDGADLGGKMFWDETFHRFTVGDAAFFTDLGAVHEFHGIDCWVATKRYHIFSDGATAAEQRE